MSVAARLDALSAAKCQLNSDPQRGVQLIASGLGCWADYIESRHADGIGCRMHLYRQTASTQTVARHLIEGAADPTPCHRHVVITDHQTAGQGRLGRQWVAPPGAALLMTAIIALDCLEVDRLSLATCCAVVHAIEEVGAASAQIRWPNDVLLDGHKVAGILVETTGDFAMIGIGINVDVDRQDWPDELRPAAISLADVGRAPDRLRLLDALLDAMEDWLFRRATDDLSDTWRSRSALLQQRITVEVDGRRIAGRVIDIDPAQGLLLDVERGPVVTLPAMTTTILDAPGMSRG